MPPRRLRSAQEPQWGDEPLRIIPEPPRTELRGVVDRPMPPDVVDDDMPEAFVPAPEFWEWIRDTFVLGSGPLQNPEHEHLIDASVGVLWTNAINISKQRTIYATAEIPQIQAGGWKRARFECQLRQWFPEPIDFLLTFSASECMRLDDRSFCALVEHELYHCAPQLDQYGNPKFNDKTGRPMYAIRGHDVEEFTGVVRRYGATSWEVRALVNAANQPPLIDGASIDIACGTCAVKAA